MINGQEPVQLYLSALNHPSAPEVRMNQNWTPIPRLTGSKLHAETQRPRLNLRLPSSAGMPDMRAVASHCIVTEALAKVDGTMTRLHEAATSDRSRWRLASRLPSCVRVARTTLAPWASPVQSPARSLR